MDVNSNGWHFKHGLSQEFMEKLKLVAESGGWFADVLVDPDFILGIRNNYMNVYWRGCSLFKIEWNGNTCPLHFTTHPKYLIDPDLSKEVSFDGSAFQVSEHDALAKQYEGPNTLARIKRAAKLYSGGEKDGVHAIALANPNVIDLEVAFRGEEQNARVTQRVDLACIEEVEEELRLRFWEAKLYSNPALFAQGEIDAPVVGQVKGYVQLIEQHRNEIVDSYRAVARNLVELASWSRVKRRQIGELVQRVANDEAIAIDETPFVGLVIYDFDRLNRDSQRWQTHMGKIEKENIFILAKGDAKGIRLRGPNSAN